MRKLSAVAVTAVMAGLAAAPAADASRTYVVLSARGASHAEFVRAIHRSGGRIVRENRRIGLATVVARSRGFATRAARTRALAGAAANRAIGAVPKTPASRLLESERGPVMSAPDTVHAAAEPGGEPLSAGQWDMRMIHATPDGSYATQPGSHDVRVWIIDTGVDGSHPDIAPNFDAALSRNFTTDDPLIDGACASDPDQSCDDPANVDENGHGTHVAGTIGAALNGIGMAGVAPKVDLVNIRAGQDSGYFFLGPSLDALTYAGDHGVDVVNMSYYIDPWLYNCAANPADSPAEQRDQRLIISATQR